MIALDRRALDVTDAGAVEQVVAAARPHVVIQCAAYGDVDGSEAREEYAREINAVATRTVARACADAGARFVYPGTDYVFDGSARRPYRTTDEARPINAYGRSKLLGERAATEAGDWLVVRTAWLYGAGRRGFLRSMVERARTLASGGSSGRLRVVSDQHGAPTWTASAAHIFAELIERRAPTGIYHATNSGGGATRDELVRTALDLAGLDPSVVEPVASDEFAAPAARPRYSVLDLAGTESIVGPIPDWRESLAKAIEAGRY